MLMLALGLVIGLCLPPSVRSTIIDAGKSAYGLVKK